MKDFELFKEKLAEKKAAAEAKATEAVQREREKVADIIFNFGRTIIERNLINDKPPPDHFYMLAPFAVYNPNGLTTFSRSFPNNEETRNIAQRVVEMFDNYGVSAEYDAIKGIVFKYD